ncbi:uncharacterized protein BXZ73DRAFT_86206 [Epithele typhae]|uniref:uncharacterized protein n=1 Tax=Epithele typhae TaxID=378194 RepID=UPI002008EB49|nr:uncharacterized protein BXZ73DRAFT_86206 [Epithele typhae]KAH9945989.1 hypothetical protein BXZ73DRAFT_86206 [Epithele typhae]
MFERFPVASVDMRNPFLVVRFALFVTGAPAFTIVNACFLITLVSGCVASSWFSRLPLDQVRIECAWTLVMSTLFLASCFDITVNGPPALCQGSSVPACASSSLVTALSWMSCLLLLLYAFSLLTVTITHMHFIEDLWTLRVPTVAWFVHPEDPLDRMEATRAWAAKVEVPDDVVHIKHATPIFAQHTKSTPISPRSPHVELEGEELAPPKFPIAPVSPLWPARPSAPEPTEPALPAPPSPAEQEKRDEVERRTTWTSRLAALPHKPSCESMRPGWAKRAQPARRGVDSPFAAPHPPPSFTLPRFSFSLKPAAPVALPAIRPLKLKSHWSQSPPPVPALPAKARVAPPRLDAQHGSPTSTFYIDLERDAVVPFGAARPISYGMFPEDVVDPDQPVTRAVRSQWVRADSDTSSER